MAHHVWGDDWFKKNGEDLGAAITLCATIWRKWGRISCHPKEKWGALQDQSSFYSAFWPVHELVKPGHLYYRWPKLFMHVEVYLGKLLKFLQLPRLVRAYQYRVYNYAVQKACARYPHITEEIVVDLDWPEYIKPGIFGDVDGMKIHNKYWKQL